MRVAYPEDTELAAAGAIAISLADDRYPALLREIHDPPAVLYLRGDPSVLLQPQIAIVGSRRASAAGLRLAHTLATELAQAGLSVCSGLALGVDGAAHRGALECGGRSVGVMATGVDQLYPRRHEVLALQLEESGCLVTEFPLNTPPRRSNFPQRNRIISGLSLGVLVVEAALPSGSLITARAAMEQGREVFALPWSPLHEGGKGCLQLLRDGVKMVQRVDDILEELGPLYVLQQQLSHQRKQRPVGAPASRLLGFLGFEVVALDSLVALTEWPVSDLLRELTWLEMQGFVQRVDGGYIRS